MDFAVGFLGGIVGGLLARLSVPFVLAAIEHFGSKPQLEIVKIANVDGVCYWQYEGDWYTAPEGSNDAHKIDLDNATPEQIHLLMQVLEKINETGDSGDEEF